MSERVKSACAILLIATSILLAGYQTIVEKDIANGVLLYIAQAFLLAGSIMGLDVYVQKVKQHEIHQ